MYYCSFFKQCIIFCLPLCTLRHALTRSPGKNDEKNYYATKIMWESGKKAQLIRPRPVHSLRGIFEKLSDNIMKLLEIKGRNVKDVPNSERSNFCSLAQRVSHNHKTRSSAFNWMLYFRVSGQNLAEFRYIPLMKKGPTVSSRTQKSWMQVLPQFKEMLIFHVSAFSYFVIFSCI